MTDIENGRRPAHPCGQKWHTVDLAGHTHDHARGVLHAGLTKRETFAMAAMQGILASPNNGFSKSGNEVASLSVMFANTLLAALDKPK